MAVDASAITGDATGRSARKWPTAVLVALTLVLTFESFRLVFPHLYGLRERSGLMVTLLVFLVVAAASFLAPLLGLVLKPYRAAALCSVLLGAWRLVVQLLDSVEPAVAVTGAVLSLITLTLVLSAPLPGGATTRAGGLLGGWAVDMALLGGFITWEPAWQRSVPAQVTGGALAVALVVVAALAYREVRSHGETGTSPAFSGGVVAGTVVALEYMFLANSAFLSAASGLALGFGIMVGVAGAAVALALVVILPRVGRPAAAAGAMLLTAAGFLLPSATGGLALGLLLAAQLGAGLVLGRALAPGGRRAGQAGLGLALGWFVGLVGILLFQLHFDSPLPVDNAYVTALLGVVTFLGVAGSRPISAQPRVGRPGLVTATVLLAAGALTGAVIAAFAPDLTAESQTGELRVVQWNLHQGVDDGGRLDPAAAAAVLDRVNREAQGQLVVVLNEVGRGWPVSGQLDLATWMSYRLGMRMAWGAASGPEFGNLVLTRFRIRSSEVVTLTHWDDYQGRSLLDVTVDLGFGREISVLGTHLQHRNTPEALTARMAEIGEILAHWAGAPATVLAGDLNPMQGEPGQGPRVPGEFVEIETLLDAGFATAGNLEACDPPTSNENCSDFILVSGDLTMSSLAVGESFADHRILVAEVVVP